VRHLEAVAAVEPMPTTPPRPIQAGD